MKKLNRRSFIKTLIAGGALSVGALTLSRNFPFGKSSASKASSNESNQITDFNYPNPNSTDYAFGMIIDLDKCDGCVNTEGDEPECTAACREMHNVPRTPTEAEESGVPKQDWIKVYFKQDNPLEKGHYFPRLCMQCENPPCVRVCPVGAALRRDKGDGLVLIDHTICIGCRLCMAACPYETRYFNWDEYEEPNKSYLKFNTPMYATKHIRGTTDKCDFCGHLGYKGEIARCASQCPQGALYYGNLKENAVSNNKGETLDVRKAVSDLGGYRFKEEIGTSPRVYYLPKRS